MIYACDIKEFLGFVNKYNLSLELSDFIQLRINALTYKEKMQVAQFMFNPKTNSPVYLQELWDSFKERIDLNNKRLKIVGLRIDSSLEDKEEVRQLINTEEGMGIFLREVLEPQFSNIIKILDLDKSFYTMRKEALTSELNEYSKYDIETVKELLCTICFNDNCNNTKLRLKTLIEYANDSDKALLLLKNDIGYIIKLYSFLTSNNTNKCLH